MATKVVDLVYWRSIGKTGVVFTGLVMGLASLFQLSAITVISFLFLGVMCVTFPVRLYYKLLELLRWNPGVHPFQSYLDEDSSLTDKDTVVLVEEAVLLIAFAVTEIKRLLFIESVIDSVKFVVFLYLLTYVGILTNGLTLVITGVIAVFSLPLLYKKQQPISAKQTLLVYGTQQTEFEFSYVEVRIRKVVRASRTFVRRIKKICTTMYNKVASVSSAEPAQTPTLALKQKAKSK